MFEVALKFYILSICIRFLKYSFCHKNIMYMIPFFPSLRPTETNRIGIRCDGRPNEEAEILRYERDYRKWLESIKNTANDIIPLGKISSVERPETDDEDANDSDDSEEDDDDEVPERNSTEALNTANTA